jgi:hypothetical protein
MRRFFSIVQHNVGSEFGRFRQGEGWYEGMRSRAKDWVCWRESAFGVDNNWDDDAAHSAD